MSKESAGFIFHIVSIVTKFSKNSDTDSENDENTSTSVTLTSLKNKGLNGRWEDTCSWVREADSRGGACSPVWREGGVSSHRRWNRTSLG